MNYKIIPEQLYKLDKENLISDGGFENFNQVSGDCCNANPSQSKVFASKSEDAYQGIYSLNLTSENQCACINKPLENFNKNQLYFVSFYYKGDKPRICNWVAGDNKCIPDERLKTVSSWTNYKKIISFTNKSDSSSIYFYADSSGTAVTNLYDDLQVYRLIPIYTDFETAYKKFYRYPFNSKEQYIIKTDPVNIINSPGAEKLTDDGYYIVMGEPDVTMKFPWSEVTILLIMMFIIIRLLFTKPSDESVCNKNTSKTLNG